jgi:hypothetical protein
MRKSTLFISAVLTTFVMAMLAGVASAYQNAVEKNTEQMAATQVQTQPQPQAKSISHAISADTQFTVTPEQAAGLAAKLIGREDLFSVEVTDLEGEMVYMVTFSSGDLVYVGMDGQILSLGKVQVNTVVVNSGGGGGGGGGGGAGTIMTMIVPVMATADGATLVSSGHQDDDPAGGGMMGALTFTNDIYPMLQRAALGGQGCANCHNGTTLAGGLAYDGPAADVYALIMGTAGVVDLATPANSMLLSYPLYEEPPNHPNATWLTTADPAYMKIMAWIGQGAPQ